MVQTSMGDQRYRGLKIWYGHNLVWHGVVKIWYKILKPMGKCGTYFSDSGHPVDIPGIEPETSKLGNVILQHHLLQLSYLLSLLFTCETGFKGKI